MTSPRPNHHDLRACLLATAATLITLLLGQSADYGAEHSPEHSPECSQTKPGDEQAMRGLINPAQAQREGAGLLGASSAAVRLSFASEHRRLVWRVDGEQASVLLDAQTGEALEFAFD
jgi:hypothetical protein